jgi:putative Mg2+ transporter-C (MgtC) family protein
MWLSRHSVWDANDLIDLLRLGAGAILRYGGSVRGLTTAAALWVTAAVGTAVGTAVGFGFWDAAIATTVVTVVALYGLKWFERKTLGRLKRGRHEFAVDALPQLKITDLAGAIESRRARIMSVRMESDDQGNQQLVLFVQLPGGMSPGDLLEALKTVDGVASVSWLR